MSDCPTVRPTGKAAAEGCCGASCVIDEQREELDASPPHCKVHVKLSEGLYPRPWKSSADEDDNDTEACENGSVGTTTDADTVLSMSKRPRRRRRVAITLIAISALALLAFAIRRSVAPPWDRMKSTFKDHKTELIRLHEMISADAKLGAIGRDRIGDYWLTGSRWTREDVEVSLESALRDVGLEEGRYNEYRRLLREVGAYRVEINPESYFTQVLWRADGTLVHGAIWFFEYRPPLTVPAVRTRTAEFKSLGDGWSVVHEYD